MEKFNKLLKTAALGLGLLAAKDVEGKELPNNKKDSVIKEYKVNENNSKDTLRQGNKIAVYTSSKTKEGGITPTGLSNSFLNNKYGVKPEDLDSIANFYGFRKDNEENFQKDMIMYVVKNQPELITEVLKEFGSTNYGEKNNLKDYRQLLDKMLGARDAFIMGNLKEQKDKTKEEKENREAEDESITKEKTEKKKEDIFNLENIDKLYILFDVSPSMRMSKDTLAKDLLKTKSEIPVEFSGFTDKIEFTNTAKNSEEASQVLKDAKLVEQNLELGIDVLIEKMEKIKKDEQKKLIVECTDEELQRVSEEKLEKIKTLGEEKNIKVKFAVMIRGEIYNITLDDVINIFQTKYKDGVEEKIKNYPKLIELRERYVREYRSEIEKTSDKKKLKELKENLKKEEQELLNLKANFVRAKEVNISDFSSVYKGLAKN